ncbi:hypothetical protein PIB30_004971 [Stylosanthes scabra]|uniref:Uncharacterized protein n=1 Tax=Stylosanthes scabra TaxID=79078 RepID=A0ABU6X2N6_9FABA|nr:hypothetical protein [Stylosanthes scabra]
MFTQTTPSSSTSPQLCGLDIETEALEPELDVENAYAEQKRCRGSTPIIHKLVIATMASLPITLYSFTLQICNFHRLLVLILPEICTIFLLSPTLVSLSHRSCPADLRFHTDTLALRLRLHRLTHCFPQHFAFSTTTLFHLKPSSPPAGSLLTSPLSLCVHFFLGSNSCPSYLLAVAAPLHISGASCRPIHPGLFKPQIFEEDLPFLKRGKKKKKMEGERE